MGTHREVVLACCCHESTNFKRKLNCVVKCVCVCVWDARVGAVHRGVIASSQYDLLRLYNTDHLYMVVLFVFSSIYKEVSLCARYLL